MKNKGFVHILVLILVVVGIGALGYFSWQKGVVKYKPSDFGVTPSPATSDCTSNVADWDIYTNNYIGFSVMYPNCWEIHSSQYETDLDKLSYFIISSDDVKLSINFDQQDYQYQNDTFNKNAQHWLTYYLSSTAYFGNSKKLEIESKNIKVDGVDAIKKIISYQFEHMKNPGISHWIYIPLKQEGKLLWVYYYSENANEEEIELYEKILSTFKFTAVGLKPCPNGFELYDGTQFSICYPNRMEKEISTFNSTDTPSRSGVSVSFTNSTELIRVSSIFAGGWGGGTCSNETTKINGYSVDVLRWDENEKSGCDSSFINLVAVIEGNNRTGVFPIAIDYQRTKGSGSLDEAKFTTMLNSFVIK